MICFHHNDLDGKCAGALVLNQFPTCVMYEIDYRDKLHFDCLVKTGEQVFIVDFSFKPEKMKELLAITDTIYWIDHHETAQDYKYSQKLMGLRDFSQECKRSGAELTWGFFNQNERYEIDWTLLPEAIRLIGDYDCWRFDTKKQTNLFQQGMRLKKTSPASPIWKRLLGDKDLARSDINDITAAGAYAIRYRDNFCASYLKSFGWPVTFEEYRCFAMNLQMVGSQGFGDRIEKYDILFAFANKEGEWAVSMYSKTVHVGEIAKRYGGGGHKDAAGFVCDNLPF